MGNWSRTAWIAPKIGNPKTEIRDKSKIRNRRIAFAMPISYSDFAFLSFGFRICSGFRILRFGFGLQASHRFAASGELCDGSLAPVVARLGHDHGQISLEPVGRRLPLFERGQLVRSHLDLARARSLQLGTESQLHFGQAHAVREMFA